MNTLLSSKTLTENPLPFEMDKILTESNSLIEWANRIPELLPEAFLEIRFEAPTPEVRRLTLLPHGPRYQRAWIR